MEQIILAIVGAAALPWMPPRACNLPQTCGWEPHLPSFRRPHRLGRAPQLLWGTSRLLRGSEASTTLNRYTSFYKCYIVRRS